MTEPGHALLVRSGPVKKTDFLSPATNAIFSARMFIDKSSMQRGGVSSQTVESSVTSDYVGTGSTLKITPHDTEIAERTTIIIVKGDVVGGDGQVKLNDVVKLFNAYNGTATLTEYESIAGDVVEDRQIKLNDVVKLFNYYNGNIFTLDEYL